MPLKKERKTDLQSERRGLSFIYMNHSPFKIEEVQYNQLVTREFAGLLDKSCHKGAQDFCSCGGGVAASDTRS